MTEVLALVHVGDVNFDHRSLEGVERIENRHRGVSVGGRIDDDGRRILAGFMDPVDQLVLGVGLQEADVFSPCTAALSAQALSTSASVSWP
jgi:hypothetical protein